MSQPTTTELTNRELLGVLWRAMPEMFRSTPLLMTVMLLLGVLGGIMPALTILISKWTVDGVTRLAGGGEANLTGLALAWAGVAVLTQVSAIGGQVIQGYVADHFTIQTMRRLMDKMNALPGLDVVEDPRFHDDVEVLQAQAGQRPLNLIAASQWLLRAIIAAVGVAATLLAVGWWVPLIVLAAMIPALMQQMEMYKLGWSMFLQKTQEARELKYHQQVAMRHEYAKEVRLYGLMPHIQTRYVGGAERYQKAIRDVRNGQLLRVLPLQILAVLVTAGLFAFTVTLAGRGALTAGSVVLVIGALAGLREQLGSISELSSMTSQHLRWFGRYYAFLDARPSVALPAQPQALPPHLDLTLDSVTFGYRDRPAVIENLSLHIPEGQIVAIVGENGAGKSTLVKLLLRFYDPTNGRILLGREEHQVDLRNVDLPVWRRQVAAVFQDFARFEWTLRDNILLGQPEDTPRLSESLRSSGLEAALTRVNDGLDARIGQAFGGVDLSGGQWQKLATARALYRDSRVLILDEPTAALDPRSEKEVFDAFAAMSHGRTTLLITHRLGSVLMADRILVMKEGRLIEDGTHAELLSRGGEYAELWRLQADQYREDNLAAV